MKSRISVKSILCNLIILVAFLTSVLYTPSHRTGCEFYECAASAAIAHSHQECPCECHHQGKAGSISKENLLAPSTHDGTSFLNPAETAVFINPSVYVPKLACSYSGPTHAVPPVVALRI